MKVEQKEDINNTVLDKFMKQNINYKQLTQVFPASKVIKPMSNLQIE